VDTAIVEHGADGVIKSHSELKRLESRGEGDTGLARDARHSEHVGLVKLGALVAIVGGVVAYVLLR